MVAGASRIIVAADFSSLEPAIELARVIGPHVAAFKLGNELAESVGAPQAVEALAEAGCKVFRDAKLIDIPNTVAGAAAGLTQPGVAMYNMMCLGGRKMMEDGRIASARKAQELNIPAPLTLGVTILTSLGYDDLKVIGIDVFERAPWPMTFTPEQIAECKINTVRQIVVKLAKMAQEAGLDGVIASAQEAAEIRAACGPNFLIVTPGIRAKDAPPDDQKRTMTAAEAIAAGADYLVIGRPVTKADKPGVAVVQFNAEIDAALAARK